MQYEVLILSKQTTPTQFPPLSDTEASCTCVVHDHGEEHIMITGKTYEQLSIKTTCTKNQVKLYPGWKVILKEILDFLLLLYYFCFMLKNNLSWWENSTVSRYISLNG